MFLELEQRVLNLEENSLVAAQSAYDIAFGSLEVLRFEPNEPMERNKRLFLAPVSIALPLILLFGRVYPALNFFLFFLLVRPANWDDVRPARLSIQKLIVVIFFFYLANFPIK